MQSISWHRARHFIFGALSLALGLSPCLRFADAQAGRTLGDPAATPPGPVASQESPAPDEETESDWRFDVLLGVGATALIGTDRGGLTVNLGLRSSNVSGHGAMLRADLLVLDDANLALFELAYNHRFWLVGTEAMGLSLDLSAGLVGGISDGPTSGDRIGAGVGASLDWRFYPFLIGVELRGRLLLSDDDVEGPLAAAITIGYWGL